jgi:hypothetical protein
MVPFPVAVAVLPSSPLRTESDGPSPSTPSSTPPPTTVRTRRSCAPGCSPGPGWCVQADAWIPKHPALGGGIPCLSHRGWRPAGTIQHRMKFAHDALCNLALTGFSEVRIAPVRCPRCSGGRARNDPAPRSSRREQRYRRSRRSRPSPQPSTPPTRPDPFGVGASMISTYPWERSGTGPGQESRPHC